MILVDTGAWLALIDRRDAYHKPCCDFFRHNQEPLMTHGQCLWSMFISCLGASELQRPYPGCRY